MEQIIFQRQDWLVSIGVEYLFVSTTREMSFLTLFVIGICTTLTISAKPDCFDVKDEKTCKEMENFCRYTRRIEEYMKVHCRKTCGHCGIGTTHYLISLLSVKLKTLKRRMRRNRTKKKTQQRRNLRRQYLKPIFSSLPGGRRLVIG